MECWYIVAERLLRFQREVGVHGPHRLAELAQEGGRARASAAHDEGHRLARHHGTDDGLRGVLAHSLVVHVLHHPDHFPARAVLAERHALAERGGGRPELRAGQVFGHQHDRPAPVHVGPVEGAAGQHRRAQRFEEPGRDELELGRGRGAVGRGRAAVHDHEDLAAVPVHGQAVREPREPDRLHPRHRGQAVQDLLLDPQVALVRGAARLRRRHWRSGEPTAGTSAPAPGPGNRDPPAGAAGTSGS